MSANHVHIGANVQCSAPATRCALAINIAWIYACNGLLQLLMDTVKTVQTVQTVQLRTLRNSMPIISFGLEQYRIRLPALAALAHSGSPSIITRHGKPYAAVVSLQALEKATASPRKTSLLALAGSGQGLWGNSPSETIAALRDEWDGV